MLYNDKAPRPPKPAGLTRRMRALSMSYCRALKYTCEIQGKASLVLYPPHVHPIIHRDSPHLLQPSPLKKILDLCFIGGLQDSSQTSAHPWIFLGGASFKCQISKDKSDLVCLAKEVKWIVHFCEHLIFKEIKLHEQNRIGGGGDIIVLFTSRFLSAYTCPPYTIQIRMGKGELGNLAQVSAWGEWRLRSFEGNKEICSNKHREKMSSFDSAPETTQIKINSKLALI